MLRLLAPVALICTAFSLAPARAPPIPSDQMFRVSLYHVAVEWDYPALRDGAFRDADGVVLYMASQAFVEDAMIEGSARTAEGAVLVFDPENPRQGWTWSAEPYGVDALGCPLIPYRTAAAPPWMPLGSRLYIPETVGLPLPDGGRHDGYWYATDRGVGITGDRIDLFMSLGKSSMHGGERFGLDYLKPIHVRTVGRLHGCPSRLAR